MGKLFFVAVWISHIINVHVSATDQVIAIAMIDKAKTSGLLQRYMRAYHSISADEAESKASNYSLIAETNVDISDLPNLRAYCWQRTQLTGTGITNAMTEFRVLEGIVMYGKAPPLMMLPPHITDYIKRLEEERQIANMELDRVQRVALMSPSRLAQSPNFSPARPKHTTSIYSDSALVHTPDRSCALFSGREDVATVSVYSPGNTAQQTPLDRKILKIRREQSALISQAEMRAIEAERLARERSELMSPMRRQLTDAERRAIEAEQQRDALRGAVASNFVALNLADVQSEKVVGAVAECLQYQSQITQLITLIERNTAIRQGNYEYLREVEVKLEILKRKLKDTFESLQVISSSF
jgi:hypothetical protein